MSTDIEIYPGQILLAAMATRRGSDMEEHTSPVGPADLGALDDYLMSDRAPDDSMGLSDLDGFLTGLVVGPELVQPSEWLPVVWAGAEPEFESEAEMCAVLGMIMGRYNEIVASFRTGSNEFDPIFWAGPEGEIIASDWAAGFLDAIALHPEAWRPLLEEDSGRLLITPIFVLSGDLAVPDATVDENELMAAAMEMVPECVANIHAFWRDHQDGPLH